MEALLPALVACLLAEMAGRVQLTTESYAVTRPAWGLCAALLLSTAISLAIGAAGGAWMARLVTYEARTLLLGLALILTGGTAIFKDLGISLDAVKLTDLGRAKKITVTSTMGPSIGMDTILAQKIAERG